MESTAKAPGLPGCGTASAPLASSPGGVQATRRAGIYELRFNGSRLAIFGPEADEEAKWQPFLFVRRDQFPQLRATCFAEGWIEAKVAFGFKPTDIQTRLINGTLSHFGLFGRFWTAEELKEKHRYERRQQERVAKRPPPLSQRISAKDLLEEIEGVCLDGPGEGEGDCLTRWSDSPLDGEGAPIHFGGREECGDEGGGEQEGEEGRLEPEEP